MIIRVSSLGHVATCAADALAVKAAFPQAVVSFDFNDLVVPVDGTDTLETLCLRWREMRDRAKGEYDVAKRVLATRGLRGINR